MPTSIEKEMSDGMWMARNQLMKPIQISQVDWSVTQKRNTNIVELRYPDLLALQESLVFRTLRMYAFYRISPVFRVQINATVFHQGQLIISFDPFELCASSPDYYVFSHIYATGLPNVKIMASYSDAVELKIPFTHPRSYLSTNTSEPYNTLGTFRITVLNPLLAAEGASSTLSVTTWVYGIDAQVHVPIQDHNLLLNYVGEDEFEQTSKISTNSQDLPVKSLLSTVLDQGKQVVGNVTDIVGNVVSGNLGQALRSGQGLINTLGSIFGFDYPSRTIQPPKTISPIENLAISKGVSQSQRLALDPFSLHKLHDDIALESREGMNLKRLMQMPMLLTQFSFTSTSTRGTLLKSIIVNPCISPIIGESLQRSYLSYISNGFVYWSGGIVYDIEIVATKFHSGKLIFAYEPNVSTPPSYGAVSDSLPNVVVDIQQSSTARFIVPYTSTTPMKDTFMPLDGDIVDSATGILCCYVQNTLAYASNVSPAIEINVYVSASDDFSLYVPQRPVLNRGGTVEEFEATSIQLVTNKNEQPESSTVLSFKQNFSIPRQQFGEDYSLLDLVKRFSPGASFDINIGKENAQLWFPVNPTFMEITAGTSSSYLSYWSKLYCCWSGSIRYKFISLTGRNTTSSLQIIHVPTTKNIRIPTTKIDGNQDFYNDFGGFGMVRTQLSQDCALEIEVPYYSKFNMLISPYSVISALVDNIQRVAVNGNLLVKCLSSNPDESITFNTYIAAGDDFRLIYPRPPPIDASLSLFTITTL